MPDPDWAIAVEKLKSYSFKIFTPSGGGTGFLLTVPNPEKICSIATAYHVISHAHQWEEPIKLMYSPTKEPVVLHVPDRFIFADADKDIALIIFFNLEFPLPDKELTLTPEDKYMKPGISVGWTGYPVVAPYDFSFFRGSISCFLQNQGAYLVDGVAINGVSGGPAFCILPKNVIHIIGVITAYIPNRVTGETLPGVCFVSSIHPFYIYMKQVKSLDEAKEKAKQIEEESNKESTGNNK